MRTGLADPGHGMPAKRGWRIVFVHADPAGLVCCRIKSG